MARHLAEHGPILYSFTFTVRDLASVERHARDTGFALIARPDDTFELDPTQTFGSIYAFTERTVPGGRR